MITEIDKIKKEPWTHLMKICHVEQDDDEDDDDDYGNLNGLRYQ